MYDLVSHIYMLCTSWDFVQVATCTKSLYMLDVEFHYQLNPTFVQVGTNKIFFKLQILLKICLLLCT